MMQNYSWDFSVLSCKYWYGNPTTLSSYSALWLKPKKLIVKLILENEVMGMGQGCTIQYHWSHRNQIFSPKCVGTQQWVSQVLSSIYIILHTRSGV